MDAEGNLGIARSKYCCCYTFVITPERLHAWHARAPAGQYDAEACFMDTPRPSVWVAHQLVAEARMQRRAASAAADAV